MSNRPLKILTLLKEAIEEGIALVESFEDDAERVRQSLASVSAQEKVTLDPPPAPAPAPERVVEEIPEPADLAKLGIS